VKRLGVTDLPDRMDRGNWPLLREKLKQKFLQKTQREWEAVFDGSDSCVTPVALLSSEDYRPIVNLSSTPGLPLNDLHGEILPAGHKGGEVLRDWIGWILNREYALRSDGVIIVLKQPSKL